MLLKLYTGAKINPGANSFPELAPIIILLLLVTSWMLHVPQVVGAHGVTQGALASQHADGISTVGAHGGSGITGGIGFGVNRV